MKNILLLTGGVFLWWIFNKKNVAEKLQYYPNTILIEKGKLIFRMDIVNPSTTQLYFDNLFATVQSNGLIVGRIQYVGRTYIQAQATTTVNFVIKAVWLDLGTFLAKVIKGEVKTVQIIGTINSMGVSIPFDSNIPIS